MAVCKKAASSIQVDECILLEVAAKSGCRLLLIVNGPFFIKNLENTMSEMIHLLCLPIRDDSKSPATIKHLINLLIQDVDILNF